MKAAMKAEEWLASGWFEKLVAPLLGVVAIVVVFAGGLGGPRLFMIVTLVLLLLIFERLDQTLNAPTVNRLDEISGQLDRIGDILGGILASMPEPRLEPGPRSD